ncbi:MAG: hypothetical protein ACWA5W_05930 [Phycisphaerales bacterium]
MEQREVKIKVGWLGEKETSKEEDDEEVDQKVGQEDDQEFAGYSCQDKARRQEDLQEKVGFQKINQEDHEKNDQESCQKSSQEEGKHRSHQETRRKEYNQEKGCEKSSEEKGDEEIFDEDQGSCEEDDQEKGCPQTRILEEHEEEPFAKFKQQIKQQAHAIKGSQVHQLECEGHQAERFKDIF